MIVSPDFPASGATVCKPYRLKNESPAIQRALTTLIPKIEAAFPHLPNAQWVALRLLEGDESLRQALERNESVTILYHGKVKGIITPAGRPESSTTGVSRFSQRRPSLS